MSASRASNHDSRTVTGLFFDPDPAERAYQAAVALGYERSDINLLMTDATRERLLSDPQAARSAIASDAAATAKEPPKGAALGGPVGGTVATIAPVIAAVGTLALIPGLVLAGPIAAALTAAGAVGVAGGLIGALTDWGIPQERVQDYESRVRHGGILIGVNARSAEHAEHLERQWRALGGELVQR